MQIYIFTMIFLVIFLKSIFITFIAYSKNMNKHSSISSFKNTSREKQKGRINPSKSNIESHPYKSIQFQKYIANLHKSKQKQTKSGSKVRNDKNRPQTIYKRHNYSNKQQSDQYRLDMKTNLKHLIRKNSVAKLKKNEVVPELLKNIETGYNALRNIHKKQRHFQQKRSSEHSNKVQKSKNQSIQYRNNQQKTNLKQSLQKQSKDIKPLPSKISTFNLQINECRVEKKKIEQKLRQNVGRKSVQNKEQKKNFVEVFKLYKKSFEIQQFKMEKSNANTNYNTNYSKNTSSHHNSYCPSRTGDLHFRGKSREQDKINIEKIEMLIKSQQEKAEIGDKKEYKQVSDSQNKHIQSVSIDFKKLNGQFLNDPIKQKKISPTNSVIEPEATFQSKYGSNFIINLQNEMLLHVRQEQNQQSIIQDKNIFSCKQKLIKEVNHPLLQKKFEKSKFYVQPVPKFELRNKEKLKQEQQSLEGCQITLIGSNIILQNSGMVQLEL